MISIPNDVMQYLQTRISECNFNVSYNLTAFPFTHEESLDHKLIGEFIGMYHITMFFKTYQNELNFMEPKMGTNF